MFTGVFLKGPDATDESCWLKHSIWVSVHEHGKVKNQTPWRWQVCCLLCF